MGNGGCGHNSSSLLLLPCTLFSCYSMGPFYGLQGTTPVWSLCAQAPRSPPALLLLSACCLCVATPHTSPLTAPCHVVFASPKVKRCHLRCRAWPCPAVGPLRPAVGRAGQLQHHFAQQLCSAPDAKTLIHAFSTPYIIFSKRIILLLCKILNMCLLPFFQLSIFISKKMQRNFGGKFSTLQVMPNEAELFVKLLIAFQIACLHFLYFNLLQPEPSKLPAGS